MYFETEIQKIRRVSRQEGRQEERRTVLLSVIDMRDLNVSAADRQRIERSRSLADLQRWLTRALQTQQKTLALD